MKLILPKNSESVSVTIFIQDPDSASGGGLENLTYENINAAYYKNGSATYNIITLQSAIVGDWVSGGFVELETANPNLSGGPYMPGLYQLDLPNDVFTDDSATLLDYSTVVMLTSGTATIVPCIIEIQLDVDVNVTQVDGIPATTGTPDVNLIQINGDTEAASDLGTMAVTGVRGTATVTTLSNTQMSTNLTSAVADFYKGRVIIWTSGALQNVARVITVYDGPSKTFTYAALPGGLSPTTGDNFVIV